MEKWKIKITFMSRSLVKISIIITEGNNIFLAKFNEHFQISDVNECEENKGVCKGGKCKNTVGSFTCDCPKGYKQHPNSPYICIGKLFGENYFNFS